MPLASQLIDIPFSGGLDSKTDPNLVAPPALLSLQNAVFAQGGTLVKRNGFQPLSVNVLGGGTVVSGKALGTFQNELLQITSAGEVYSYLSSQDAWIDRGACSPMVVTDSSIVRNSYTQSNPDCDTAHGVTVFAWEDTRGGVRASVYDEATGAALLPDVSISATGASPRVVACGTSILVLYADSSTLAMRTLDATAPTAFAVAVTLDSNMPGSGTVIDAKPYDGFSAVVAWNYSGGTRIAIAVAAGYEGSPVNGYPSPVNVAQSCTAGLDVTYDPGNSRFWLLSSSSSGLFAATLTFGFVADLAPTQIDSSASVTNVTGLVSGTTMTAYYEVTAAATYNHLLESNTVTTGGTVGTPAVGMRSVGLASKVFTNAGRTYLAANYQSALQPTAFLFDVTSATWAIVAKGQPFLSGGLYTSGMVPRPFTTAANMWSLPAPTRVQIDNSTTAVDGTITSYTSFFLVGIDRLNLSFSDPNAFNNIEAGNNTLFAGGVISMYDGVSVVEHGFHLFPENVSAVPSSSGGSMADGTYGIAVVWYWQDAEGQIHRSAPCATFSVTVSGGSGSGSIALTIPTLRLTAKSGARTAPIAAVFRTPVNGTLLQRVGNGAADPVTAPVYSTTSADTVAFSLTVADTAIAANEILYTTGGTLPNVAPGACSQITTSGARVFLAGIVGQPLSVAYSQTITEGVPVEFATQLAASVDPRDGAITGVGIIDGTTVIFKKSSTYAMAGDGPDSTGNQNTFTSPSNVTSDVGTVVPNSITTVPMGLIFQSAKGKYLLDRSLNVTYVGASVEGFNSLTCTSGITVAGSNQVRFTANDGVLLMFDYFFRQWGTFANLYGSAPTFLASDAVLWPQPGAPSVYVYLSTAGTVLYETPGAYLDTNNPVAVNITTAWIKLANLQGFVKIPWVTVLGRFFSDHVLRVGVAYDYEGFNSEYHNFDSGLGTEVYGTGVYGAETPYGGVSNTVYQFRFRPDTMKCQSIQFSFSEQSPSNGEGFALSGLTLQAAIAQGPFKKLPAGQTVASS